MKLPLLIPLLAIASLAASAPAQGIAEPQNLVLPQDADIAEVKDTGKEAIESVMAQFAAHTGDIAARTFAILPLARDVSDGYFTLQFENAFTQIPKANGMQLFTRRDAVLEQVITEIDFQQSYADAVKPDTRQKLALKGVEAVILPRIDIDRSPNGAMTLRASISVHHVTSGEKMWGYESSRVIGAKWTQEQLIRYGVIALAFIIGLFLLRIILRVFRNAARPR